MKSTIRIDFSELGNEPVISIKSISSSDDLRDKSLINFLKPIQRKLQRGAETFLHIQHKGNFAGCGPGSECGDYWEVSSFPTDMRILNRIEGMYEAYNFLNTTQFSMCNTGAEIYFDQIHTPGMVSEKLDRMQLEQLSHTDLIEHVIRTLRNLEIKAYPGRYEKSLPKSNKK